MKNFKGIEMVLGNLIDRLPIKSHFMKMISGALITALIISLSIYGIPYFWGFKINAGIPAAFAAIGASLFAARYKKEKDSKGGN